MCAKPSGNAVKHGLASLAHLPRGREHELPPILADLTASRQPETPEQVEIVEELAFAMWQRGEAERLYAEQAEPKLVDAEALFNKQRQEAYDELFERYATNPGSHVEAMAQTVMGVKFFGRIWTNLLSSLADGASPPSLKQACNLIKTLGFYPSPIFIAGEGEIMMKQVLALKPNPEKAVAEWLENENLASSHDASVRARVIRENLPTAGEARNALLKRAQERVKFWKTVLDCVKENEELARLEFVEKHQFDIELDPAREAMLNRFQRYAASSNSKIRDLNRRLTNLKTEALKTQRRAEDAAEKQKDREFQAMKLAQQKHEFRAREHRRFNVPVPDPDETDGYFYRVPSNWQAVKQILPMIKPNFENFMFWKRENLDKAHYLFEYLEGVKGIDGEWLRQLKEFYRLELAYRDQKLEQSL